MDFIPIAEAQGLPDLIEQLNTRLGDIYDTAFEAKNIGITIPAEKVDGDHAIRMTVQEALVPLFGTSPAVIDADDTMSGVKWTDLTDGGDTVLHKHDIYGELASAETVTGLWTFSDRLDVDGIIRSTGTTAPSSGAGTWLGYNAAGPYGYLLAYDSDAPAYKEMRVLGNPISFHPNDAGEEVQIVDGQTYIRGILDIYGNVLVQPNATLGPSGAASWQFVGAPSQINLVNSAALMIGDAQKIFFEASGTTQGTESIYSAAGGRLDVLADTNFDINIGGAEVSTFDAGGLNLATGTGIDINGVPFIQYINTSTIVMGIGAAAAGADNESVIIGDNAGAALTTGDDRMTVIGHNAAVAWTSNRSLIGGYGAANGGTGGTLDVILGPSAVGVGSFTGTRDTVVGAQCARDLTTSNDSCYYGYRSGDSVTTGDEEAIYGASAGISITTEDKNSYFGAGSGSGATSHSGAYFGYKSGFTGPGNLSVCLGPYAGYYETAASALFIDNAQRIDEADGRVKALIYGVFAAATADQLVRFNAAVEILHSLTIGTTVIDEVVAARTISIGNAEIGISPAFGTTYMSLGHTTLDQSVSTNYALLQASNGPTLLNSPTQIHIRVGNSDQILVQAALITVSETMLMSTTEPLQFGDSATYINQRADTFLALVADGAIELGDQTSGNYSEVEADGTIVAHGTATSFDDIYVGFSSAKVPAANFPNWESFLGNLNAYTFAVNDYLELDPIELEHSYLEGSNIYLHVHWATNGVDLFAAKYVKWEIEYTIANSDPSDGVGGLFPATVVVSAETAIPAATPAPSNMYTAVATVAGAAFTIGAILKMRIRRIVAVGAAPADNPFGLMVGVHIEKDTKGSRTQTTK